MNAKEKYAFCSDCNKWAFNSSRDIRARMMMNEKDLIELHDIGK